MIDDHVDKLMAVMDEAFDPHWREAWTRTQVTDSLLMPSCYMLLAGADGGPCGENERAEGFVLARHAPGEDELLLIGVRPAARGRGVGRTLLSRFETEARGRGAEQAFLEMRSNNPAQRLYRAAGYLPIGRRPAYYRTLSGDAIDALTFGKSLQSTESWPGRRPKG